MKKIGRGKNTKIPLHKYKLLFAQNCKFVKEDCFCNVNACIWHRFRHNMRLSRVASLDYIVNINPF